ncbi:MAG: hypothetical protein DRP67_02510 [Candidatus Omnitrophota bacterium]|nr:MAG: hypothetical protein DRP67_02510 [Candidatus Omnitrophota bacterium]
MVNCLNRIIVAGILIFLSACSKNPSFLAEYQSRYVVKDGDGNQYKVVYKSRSPYGCDIFVYKSLDGGKWEKAGIIPFHESYQSWGYFLTWCDGILYFVFIGEENGKKWVYFSKSLDGGNRWSIPLRVNDDVDGERRYPKIASIGKDIFVIWIEENEGFGREKGRKSGIYFCSSSDGGERWGRDKWIGKGEDTWISVDKSGTVYVAYIGGKRKNIIFLSYSEDKGKTWHTETTGGLPLMVKEPYILSLNKTIYLVFQGTRPDLFNLIPGTKLDYQIYYLKSEDKGKNWSKIIRVK